MNALCAGETNASCQRRVRSASWALEFELFGSHCQPGCIVPASTHGFVSKALGRGACRVQLNCQTLLTCRRCTAQNKQAQTLVSDAQEERGGDLQADCSQRQGVCWSDDVRPRSLQQVQMGTMAIRRRSCHFMCHTQVWLGLHDKGISCEGSPTV